jgi:23S rRNA (pseudouridine1915-N3)-methyltransferase
MKVKLLQVGKTEETYLDTGVNDYKKRLKHYANTEEITIKSPANAAKQGAEAQKMAEGKEILKNLTAGERLVLLDENGREYSSREFAAYVEKAGVAGIKNLVFVIGGPFGFSEEVYAKADAKISLSRMTFSHQMVRLFFWEQLYRAFTIIKGEKYHHD